MKKKVKGPAFVRFVAPVLETLQELGGSGVAGDVTDRVIQRMRLSEEELAQTTSNGQSRVRNQIGWARFYLAKADLLHGPQRGSWKLTRKGQRTKLDEESAFQLFKTVHEQFERVANETEGAAPVPEDPPGIEAEDDKGGHKQYPWWKTSVITKVLSLDSIVLRMSYDEIDLAFGKTDPWNEIQKSRFIESALVRIPLPALYFDATDDRKWYVIDGLRRLSAIWQFMVEPDEEKRLRLQGLDYLQQHEGKRFKELPRDLQRRIEQAEIVTFLVQPGTPSDVIYRIYQRINPDRLPSETYMLFRGEGSAMRLLQELANSDEFLDATGGEVSREPLLGCEFVLRFISFSLTPYQQYDEADMGAFLIRHMGRLNDDGEGPARDDLRRRFKQAMRAAREIFGEDAFRKRFEQKESRRSINKSLFEAWSVALGNLDPASLHVLIAKSDVVKSVLIEVLNKDHEFEAAITRDTGDVAHVHKRFSTIEQIITQALKGPP